MGAAEMIRTGIDLVDIGRIRKLLGENPEGFLKRICTPGENRYLTAQKRIVEKTAACFALKEAFSKALGTGIGEEFSFHDAEVTYSPAGQPLIRYIGQKMPELSHFEVSCSISHEGDLLAAIVVLMGASHDRDLSTTKKGASL